MEDVLWGKRKSHGSDSLDVHFLRLGQSIIQYHIEKIRILIVIIRNVSLISWVRCDEFSALRLIARSTVLMNNSKVSNPFIATISLLKYLVIPRNQKITIGRKITCFIRLQIIFSD